MPNQITSYICILTFIFSNTPKTSHSIQTLNRRLLHSEVHLIRRIRESDKLAFELIFNLYKKKLYYFANSYLHSSAESEEILQNVFISLWENRETLKEELSLQNYLYKATVNHVYNYFKHKMVRQKYVDNLLMQELLEDDHSQQSILYNDLKDIIDNLIGDLPSRQQLIFKLSRQEGLSHNEIARHLGLSVRSVENQIYRALIYIKENLNKEHLIID